MLASARDGTRVGPSIGGMGKEGIGRPHEGNTRSTDELGNFALYTASESYEGGNEGSGARGLVSNQRTRADECSMGSE